MLTGEQGFLLLAISAFSLFGGVLAWACWMESRDNKRKAAATPAKTEVLKVITPTGVVERSERARRHG